MILTINQLGWLYQQGGRTASDVVQNDYGELGIYMRSSGQWKFVYLPADNLLIREKRKTLKNKEFIRFKYEQT